VQVGLDTTLHSRLSQRSERLLPPRARRQPSLFGKVIFGKSLAKLFFLLQSFGVILQVKKEKNWCYFAVKNTS
jgi:hypothetical protein